MDEFQTRPEKARPASLPEQNPTGEFGAAPRPDLYGEYDQNGVDVSLIRYMLRLSPLERLEQMEQHARDTQVLFDYGRQHRETKASQDR